MTRLRGLAAAFASLVLVIGCAGEKRTEPASTRGPVILISIDTLRADHLSAWGYTAVATPAIDRLAAESVLFENAYSHVPLTLPSHVSILTGLLPPEHGVRNNIGYAWDPAKHPSITSVFEEAGYETGAAVSAYVLRGRTGMSEAFGFYDDAIANESGVPTGQLQRPGSVTAERAEKWILQRTDGQFFFMLHLFEPHAPYEPPPPFSERYVDKYDGEIAAADDVAGSFLDFLKNRGLYDAATIVLFSDHGEGLEDHGEQEHGIFLYREAIHVPLLIKLPNGEKGGSRISAPVGLTDIAPTLLRLKGLTSKMPELPGVDLFAGNLPSDRSVYSETLYPRLHLGWSELRSVIDAEHHYIEAPTPELYDHVADPHERENILTDRRREYAALRKELETHAKKIERPSNVEPEEARRLAALGYIGTIQNAEGDLPDPKDQIGDFEKMKHAGRLISEGHQGRAVTVLRGITSRNPKFADAWSLMASAYEGLGRDGDAIEAYREGLRNTVALRDEMALSMAGLLLKVGHLDEAEEHARLALDGQPGGAHQMLARIAIQRGDFDEAEREASLAMDDPTRSLRSSVLIAEAKARQGRVDEALGILSETKRKAEGSGMSVEYLEYAIGDIEATRQRWPEAESAFLSEIDRFPRHLQAYASLTVVYVLSGQYAKVDPTLERMLRANPGRVACLTAAETLETLGDDRTAEQWRRRAASFD